MYKSDRPQIVFFAGVNGAGKSTVYQLAKAKVPSLSSLVYINPDVLTEGFNGDFIQGAKTALRKRQACLDLNISFAFESTFSGKSEFRVLEEAKSKGYKINGVLVGVNNSAINYQRIRQRVSLGGHAVNKEDVLRREIRLKMNYQTMVELCDRLYVVDNNRSKPFLAVLIKDKKVIRCRPPQGWVQEFITAIRIKSKEAER